MIALRWLGDLKMEVAGVIGVLLITSSVYLISVFQVLYPGAKTLSTKGLFGLVVLPAILFRVTLWPLAPGLSDDIYRYRWEGKLQAFGGNPYQARPADPAWKALADVAHPLVVGKDFKAVYGPLTELLEAATYKATAAFTRDPFQQAFWFKVPAAVFDLAILPALILLLRALNLAPERLLVYAWCPLPAVEFWTSGHNDALLLLLLVLALWAAVTRRWTGAVVLLMLAGAVKIWPFLLLPVFLYQGMRQPEARRGVYRGVWFSLALLGLLCSPYLSQVTENARFLSGFLGGWRNNDSFYGLFLWATGDQYRAKYLSFGILAAAAVWVTLRRWPLPQATLAIVVVILLVSANCHPWYLTWFLPLLAIHPVPPLFLWISLIPIAYLPVIGWGVLGDWNGVSPMRWLIYGPLFVYAGGDAAVRFLVRKKMPPR